MGYSCTRYQSRRRRGFSQGNLRESANKRSGANPASLKLLTSPVAPIPVPSVRRPFAVSCCRNQSTAKFVQRAGDVLCRVGGDGNVRVTSATGTIPGQFQMPETYHHGAVVLVNIQDLRARFLRASVSGQILAAGGRRSEGRRAWWCTVFPAWLPVVGTGRSGTQSRPCSWNRRRQEEDLDNKRPSASRHKVALV